MGVEFGKTKSPNLGKKSKPLEKRNTFGFTKEILRHTSKNTGMNFFLEKSQRVNPQENLGNFVPKEPRPNF